MKTFNNIIILALIGLLSSTYLFNLSPIDYRGTISIDTPDKLSTLSLKSNDDNLLNPDSVTINHVSANEETVKSISDTLFTLDVYQGEKTLKSGIRNLELVSPSINMSISVKPDDPIVTTLDINQKKLGLEDGTYTFVFTSQLISEPEKSTLSINVTYDTGGSYYPATSQEHEGTRGLTLYFTTKNSDTLIPVTRFVVEDKSITRMAIEQLQNGPLNSEMKSVIKDVTNTTYNNGNVVIDLPSSYEGYNNGTEESSLAYKSFVKTIFNVDRYWPIYNVTFTVDRKKVDTYFNGLGSEDINSLPNEGRNYLLYMAYKLDDRFYLFDYEPDLNKLGITENDAPEIKAQKLFDGYKDSDISYGRSPVPEYVSLNNAAIQETTLILDFNSDFLNAYKGKDDLKQMMIESFIYTFTSIPGVDSIKITVNGEDLKSFVNFPDGRDLSGILYPPVFINPEIVTTHN